MKLAILASIILASVLLFGCIGGPQEQQGKLQGNGTVPGNTVGTTQPPQGGTTTPAQNGGQGGTGGTVEDAIKAGIPYECIITSKQAEFTSTTHLWIKGSKVYIEATQMGQQVRLIGDDKKVYADASRQPYSSFKQVPGYSDCAWILFESNQTGETYQGMPNTQEFYATPQQGYSVDCKPAEFGDEKFATPGRICNINDIMNSMYSGMPQGFEYPE